MNSMKKFCMLICLFVAVVANAQSVPTPVTGTVSMLNALATTGSKKFGSCNNIYYGRNGGSLAANSEQGIEVKSGSMVCFYISQSSTVKFYVNQKKKKSLSDTWNIKSISDVDYAAILAQYDARGNAGTYYSNSSAELGTITVTHGDKNTADISTYTNESVVLPAGKYGFYLSTHSADGNFIKEIVITPSGSTPPTPSTDATLSSVTYDGTLVPNFSATQTTYNVTLPMGTTQCPTVSATPNASNAQAVVTYDPENRSLPNTVTITVTAPDGTTQNAYTVNFSVGESQTIPVTGISLNKTTTTLTVGETETLIATIQPANATNQAISWRSTNESVATVSETGVVTAVATGTTTITVTSESGNPVATCTVNVTAGQVTPPPTTLSLHTPYIYEDPIAEGGYAGTLTQHEGRDWEVYYTGRHKKDGNNRVLVVGTTFDPNGSDGTTKFSNANIVTTDETETACKAIDGWFTADYVSTSNASSVSGKDMFIGGATQWKIMKDHYLELHIQGYDGFAIYAGDNNGNESKGKHFEVYVDGVKQSMTLSTTETVRYFTFSTDEHLIKVVGIGGSNNYLYGFALRPVAVPRVKYVAGNNSTQVVYQTDNIQPIAYVIRNADSYHIEIQPFADGITLQQGAGDTVYVTGVANCPVGQYRYNIIAASDRGTATATGQFDVETHLSAHGSTGKTININEPMHPIVFDYYALDANDITWNTPIDHLQFVIDTDAKTVAITGTPIVSTDYIYTLTIAGGNTIEDTIHVNIPGPVIITPADSIVRVKNQQAMPTITWKTKYVNNVSVSSLPNGVIGQFNLDAQTFTISGTPNVSVANYPATYSYTLTATGVYTNETITATGTIIIIDPNALAVLYLNFGEQNDALLDYLNTKYEVTVREAENSIRTAEQYNPYNVIIISEAANAVNEEVLNLIRNRNKPILNMQPYTYTQSRLNWGKPNYGSATATKIKVLQPTHPIFNGFTVQTGSELQLLDSVDGKGLMSVDVILQNNSIALASSLMQGKNYEDDGDNAVFVHEVQGTGRKYLLLPLSVQSASNLTNTGKRLIDNAITYLNSQETVAFNAPTLRITKFAIDGTEGTIDETNAKIHLQLPVGTDLSALTPQITLLDDATFVTPNSGEVVDFSNQHFGVDFVVTDLIHRRVYTAYVTLPTDIEQGLASQLFFDGQTLYNKENQALMIYNVFGQLITYTNTDFRFSGLQSGVYLIVNASGETLKVLY